MAGNQTLMDQAGTKRGNVKMEAHSTQSTQNDFASFSPAAYLQEYYDHIGPENDELLRFFAEAFKLVPPETVMLEFGGGPTIYQLISAAVKVSTIDFTDYLD